MTSVIEQFYSAFQSRDAAGMAACYHPQIVFNDPVFRDLRGPRAAGMWAMLLKRSADLKITYRDVREDGATGSAHWEARYTFSQSRRPVHNFIEARFRLQDGKIIEHTDHFDFWRWSRMALGTPGILLGWSPIIHNKVQQTAMAGLEKYMRDHASHS
jgi:ketosteroid isomerase-like protein